MGQSIVRDEVAGANKMANRRFVRGVPANKDNGVIDANEICNALLELAMHGLFAGNQAAGGDAGAVLLDGFLGGGVYDWIARHGDVVVCGEANQLAPADPGGVP